MERNKIIRHILGYSIGFSIFTVIIPWILVNYSTGQHPVIHLEICGSLVVRVLIAIPLFILGLTFVIGSNIALFQTGKGGPADGFNIAISPRTEKLVVTGPYRYTRNPMVLGTFSAYFAIAVFLNSVACIILLTICFFLAVFYLKLTEEKRLYNDFEKTYLDYKKEVPMIIPFTKRRQNKQNPTH